MTDEQPCRFDFSEYHPLDHHWWEPYCWGWYGGIPRHISLWWDYQRPRPIQDIKCRFDRHEWTDYWRGQPFGEDVPRTGEMCSHCLVKR